MARLYLHCAICDRKQADGLLSGAAWGRVDVSAGIAGNHPSFKGGALRVCPGCVQRHADWRERIVASLGIGGTTLEAAQ